MILKRFLPFEERTKYSRQKITKMQNYTYLNETVCLKGQTVLAGDSITEIFNSYELFYRWSKENDCAVYNRGISGDTSNRLLERFDANVLNIEPRNIVLLIGTNDLGFGATVQYTADNVKAILTKIREKVPNANVILEAVYPVNKNLSSESKAMVGIRKNSEIKLLNGLLKSLSDEFGCIWLDLTDALSDENGNLRKDCCYDGLHLNVTGFHIVSENIIPNLR